MQINLTRREFRGAVQVLEFICPTAFEFAAGQYLTIKHADGPIPLSIASAPHQLPRLHLHYQSVAGVPEAQRMNALLENIEPHFEIEGPAGDVFLQDPIPPSLCLIVAGTGAAQATSFIEALNAEPAPPKTQILWSVSTPEDLYQDAFFDRISKGPWLDYIGFVDDRKGNNRLIPWLREHPTDGERIVIAGAPGFVYATVDALLEAGVPEARMESDVFAYAPRAPN